MKKKTKQKRKIKKVKSKFGKLQVHLLDVEPYNQQCIIVINGQLSDGINYLKTLKDINPKRLEVTLKYYEDNKKELEVEKFIIGDGSGRLYPSFPFGYFMLISHQESWIQTTGVICHESLHLATYILDHAGINSLNQHRKHLHIYNREW